MKILILGGTRFFGRETALLLAREGHEVTVMTRGRIPAPPEVTHVLGDRGDPSVLQREAARGYDALIDNVAVCGEHVRAALTAFAGRTGHYVLTSSAAVYLAAGRPPYFEEAAPAPLDKARVVDEAARAYTLGKIAAEWALLEQDEVSFSIVRPPVVIGPHDPTLRLWFYAQRVLDRGPVLLADSGKHTFHLADSLDLARGFVQILQAGSRAFGQAYTLCQSDVLSLEELLGAVAEALGREARTVVVPADVLRSAGLQYPDPMGSTHPFHSALITPPHKACRELGFRPRPVLEAVADAARWHGANPGPPSEGYERRQEEIRLAEHYRQAVRACLRLAA
jgi:2'-hydroxyisoflavone reductase